MGEGGPSRAASLGVSILGTITVTLSSWSQGASASWDAGGQALTGPFCLRTLSSTRLSYAQNSQGKFPPHPPPHLLKGDCLGERI